MAYLLGVFGNPISHSLSPHIHAQFAKQFNLDIRYEKYLASKENFAEQIQVFFNQGGYGANITAPFKEMAFQYSQARSDRALAAASVNTLTKRSDNIVFGDNTDGIGFIEDLSQNLKFDLRHQSLLLLGAGGAMRGLLPEIIKHQPKSIHIANRTLEKALYLSQVFQNDYALTYSLLNEIPEQSYDLVIHGLSSIEVALPSHIFQPNCIYYDLSYQLNQLTPFLNSAKKLGCHNLHNGLGMLIQQAAFSFEQWFGAKPNTKKIKF